MAARPVVYRLPGMESVRITRDAIYRQGTHGPLGIDVYAPPAASMGERRGAVVFAIGYPDLGAIQRFGCLFKEMESYVSWARLIAATGMIGITYRNEDPAADLASVLAYIERHAADLGVDPARVGLWSCSGNGPVGLSRLLREARPTIACAVFCYALLLDGKEGWVSQAAKMFGFANPCAGHTISDLVPDVPLFVVRAGKDEIPHLNDTIDAFAAEAIARNLSITFVNHPSAPHAFDVVDDSAETRDVIERILAFYRFNLRAD
jgi:acetyl esterase/lipase